MGDIAPDIQTLIYRGVQERINLFFNDFTKVIVFAKNKNLPNNRVDYLKSIKNDFLYIDPLLAFESNMEPDADLNKIINHDVEYFFKRITQNATEVIINPLIDKNYRKPEIPGKLFTDYTEITFIGDELAPFFGHAGPIMVKKSKTLVTTYQPAIKLRNTNFFLYCDQIREQHVNEVLTPLLATIPIPSNSKFGDPVHYRVTNPHYLNLKNNNIAELHFTLKNRQGESVKFKNSSQTIILLLLLRPTKRGVI